MSNYEVFMKAYEEHLMWCLDNNGLFNQQQWNSLKSINFYDVTKKYNIKIEANSPYSHLNN